MMMTKKVVESVNLSWIVCFLHTGDLKKIQVAQSGVGRVREFDIRCHVLMSLISQIYLLKLFVCALCASRSRTLKALKPMTKVKSATKNLWLNFIHSRHNDKIQAIHIQPTKWSTLAYFSSSAANYAISMSIYNSLYGSVSVCTL